MSRSLSRGIPVRTDFHSRATPGRGMLGGILYSLFETAFDMLRISCVSCVEVLGTSFQPFMSSLQRGRMSSRHIRPKCKALRRARAVGLDVLLCLSAINFPLSRLGLVLKATSLQLAAATLKFVLAL